jgi:hypothetical protein
MSLGSANVTGAGKRQQYRVIGVAQSVVPALLLVVLVLSVSMSMLDIAHAQADQVSIVNQSHFTENEHSDSHLDSIEQKLAARGLLGRHLVATAGAIEPPTGIEVDETVQISRERHETISSTRSWNEQLDEKNVLHVELTSFPSKQTQVAFWVLPHDSRGCAMFGRTMYDANGHPLQSDFWRNDRELRITGAADFPADLYPQALPAIALLRALDSLQQGSSGKINQQLSPYGFVDQQVTVESSAPIEVPAGRFAAVRVDSEPNVSTILPSWPRFTLAVVRPFLPQTTYYFQAESPHRLLRKEQAGTPFIGGPEATTELVRYYIVGSTASAEPTQSTRNQSVLQ